MLLRFDHVTLVVRDASAAKRFFALLGFREVKAVAISGEKFARYMGVDGIDAEHVTLELAGAAARVEVQLLQYRKPPPHPDTHPGDLNRLGFNHICFAVDNLDAEVARLRAAGVVFRNEIMEFHDRKLIFLAGPEGTTVELAQWIK